LLLSYEKKYFRWGTKQCSAPPSTMRNAAMLAADANSMKACSIILEVFGVGAHPYSPVAISKSGD
jgi:hypothetical protein